MIRYIIFVLCILFITNQVQAGSLLGRLFQDCPKKLILYINMEDQKLKAPQAISIKVTEIKKITQRSEVKNFDDWKIGYLEVDQIGSLFIEESGGKLPNMFEIDIKILDHCPFISKIDVSAGSLSIFHGLRWSDPPFMGQSFTPFLQPSSVSVRFHSNF